MRAPATAPPPPKAVEPIVCPWRSPLSRPLISPRWYRISVRSISCSVTTTVATVAATPNTFRGAPFLVVAVDDAAPVIGFAKRGIRLSGPRWYTQSGRVGGSALLSLTCFNVSSASASVA